MGEQGWLTLVKEPKQEHKGLLAIAQGTQDKMLPAAINTLLQEYVDVFVKPGTPAPRHIQHRIEFLDENKHLYAQDNTE